MWSCLNLDILKLFISIKDFPLTYLTLLLVAPFALAGASASCLQIEERENMKKEKKKS